jgi:hypothetical protein
MKEDPIVAEVRRIRAGLLEEAGHDLDRLAELIEQAVTKIPHTGPPIRNAEELRRHVAQQEAAASAVRETPPKYGQD